MKIFTNKNLIQKVIIAFVCIMLLNFCMAPRVEASLGGTLFEPMKDFITTVADIFITLVQWGITGEWVYAVDDGGAVNGIEDNHNFWLKPDNFRYPIIQISPELIFGNKIELLNIDFIGGDPDEPYEIEATEDGKEGIEKLREVIATWYVTLRTIAIIGLLSVLIYVGIRIIISSTSQDRAKYKQRLIDWIVAFCLLFFMHYIMAATVNIIDMVTKFLGETTGVEISLPSDHGYVKYDPTTIQENENGIGIEEYTYNILTVLPEIAAKGQLYIDDWYAFSQAISLGYLSQPTTETNGDTYTATYTTTRMTDEDSNVPIENAEGETLTVTMNIVRQNGMDYITGGSVTTTREGIFNYSEIETFLQYQEQVIDNSGVSINTPTISDGLTTDVTSKSGKTVTVSSASMRDGSKILYFINYARLFINVKSDHWALAFGYLILYIILIVFTVMFAIRYVKRVIYIAFLTLMAPLVALTYPIDKLKDRKSTSIQYVV